MDSISWVVGAVIFIGTPLALVVIQVVKALQ